MSDEVERTLSVLREAHVYTLPPRPGAGGYRCQDWPKTNHIFTGRVRIVAKGDLCTVRLENPADSTLFAQCPLDNENPQVSVEPVLDSSRYFVLRVSDGSGRYAYLGMGFLERPDAFEFNEAFLADLVAHRRRHPEDDLLTGVRLVMTQEVMLEGKILFRAEVTAVCTSLQGQPARLPPQLRQKLH